MYITDLFPEMCPVVIALFAMIAPKLYRGSQLRPPFVDQTSLRSSSATAKNTCEPLYPHADHASAISSPSLQLAPPLVVYHDTPTIGPAVATPILSLVKYRPLLFSTTSLINVPENVLPPSIDEPPG